MRSSFLVAILFLLASNGDFASVGSDFLPILINRGSRQRRSRSMGYATESKGTMVNTQTDMSDEDTVLDILDSGINELTELLKFVDTDRIDDIERIYDQSIILNYKFNFLSQRSVEYIRNRLEAKFDEHHLHTPTSYRRRTPGKDETLLVASLKELIWEMQREKLRIRNLQDDDATLHAARGTDDDDEDSLIFPFDDFVSGEHQEEEKTGNTRVYGMGGEFHGEDSPIFPLGDFVSGNHGHGARPSLFTAALAQAGKHIPVLKDRQSEMDSIEDLPLTPSAAQRTGDTGEPWTGGDTILEFMRKSNRGSD